MFALLPLFVFAHSHLNAAHRSAWEAWKDTHAKEYSEEEEAKRFEIFQENMIYINKYNEAKNGIQLDINQFADLTTSEFTEKHLTGFVPSSKEMWGGLMNLGVHEHFDDVTPADSIDWVENGAVTGVKNQGSCGSCWTFSTTGALEGAWEIATGNLVTLSEQQFVDCSKQNNGCHGGSMDLAFTYAKKHAICTEEAYAYDAADGHCSDKKCKKKANVGLPKGAVVGYKDVETDSMHALMSAVAQQPVSIAIEADKTVFQFYKSGVLTGNGCGNNLDHGVLLVGYGTENGKDYWKVKNSWGNTWGADGYILLERGLGGSGECGLLKMASYPVVHKKGTEEEELNILV